jgi:signal transduction histidine kinase
MTQPVAPFILIVDDNATNLSVLSQSLKSAGYKVRMAANGNDALAQIERALPELILLDVQMPGIDGFETCRRLQANPTTQRIPVIFMTALADAESKVKGLSLGAVDYITKPFEQAEVLARVKVHWQLKRLTDGLEAAVAERTDALQQAQVQLVQQEKLSALGELVAGVAHEINNPLSFIISNIAPAKEYLAEITALLQLYQQHYPEPISTIAQQLEALDLAFTLSDFASLLNSMELGTERMKEIAMTLRNFARTDGEKRVATDLHQGLEGTLLLLKHRLKNQGTRPEIEVVRQYGNLPLVECYPGPLNQVFMNLLANAIDALEEAWEKDQRPLTLRITTEPLAEAIAIQIVDNALGMSEATKQRLFEPLFTTKATGKGTGLGLSISRQIVTEKHHGHLSCQSTPGQGTEFRVELPRLDS